MQLYFHEMGPVGAPPMVILHGLFGSADNWLTVARPLSARYRVYLPDQRNHGRSPHSDQFNYPAMAADLGEFMTAHGIADPVLVGHSMGGKVAMHYATAPTAGALAKLVVVDIAPRYYPPHHHDELAGLLALDLASLESRQQADDALAHYLPDAATRQFLLKNLYRRDDDGPRFGWRLNLPVIARDIERVGEALPPGRRADLPTLFVKGAESDYLRPDDWPAIQAIFPFAQLVTIADAGHWVQAQQPQAFVAQLLDFLPPTP